MANIYELLLSMGSTPENLQQLMEAMRQSPQTPLIMPGQPGMRGDIASRAPARSQPTGIYRPPQGLRAR